MSDLPANLSNLARLDARQESCLFARKPTALPDVLTSRRNSMVQKSLTDPDSDPREPEAAVTRREWLQGTAATGAALTLAAEAARAGAAPSQLLVGVGKRIITPNPLLPVSGG